MEDVGRAEGCIWACVTLPSLFHRWVSQCAAVPAGLQPVYHQISRRTKGWRLQAGWFVLACTGI